MKRLRPGTWQAASWTRSTSWLRALSRHVARCLQNIPIAADRLEESALFPVRRYPRSSSIGVLRTVSGPSPVEAEELATELARDVLKDLNILWRYLETMRGDSVVLLRRSSPCAKMLEQAGKLKAAMTETDPAKQAAMLAALPAELPAAGRRAMQAIQGSGRCSGGAPHYL